MMKYTIGAVLLIILVLGGYMYLYKATPAAGPITSSTPQTALAPQVEKVLAEQITTLQTLAADPIIVAETKTTNDKNKDITQAQINTLDQEWQNSKGITPFIRTFLENATAQRLLAFQREHPGFKEIFVADAHGLNVGQTDKTSDYYQADESWWTGSFAGGKGKSLHGAVEFDASSQTQSIAIYVPIRDPESGSAIGVLKGVFDVAAISQAL
jgi:hypothetical protein